MGEVTATQLGFRMPAEWEPHEATWLAWPHERSDWPVKFAPIPWVYGDIVRKLTRVERVRILVEDAALEKSARRVLAKCTADMSAVEFFRWPTNRSWTRDYCPIFVRNDVCEIAITNWRGQDPAIIQRLMGALPNCTISEELIARGSDDPE